MVHELIGIRNNRVDMSRCPGISKELQVLAITVITFELLELVTDLLLKKVGIQFERPFPLTL